MDNQTYIQIKDALVSKGYNEFQNAWERERDTLQLYDTSFQRCVKDERGKRYYLTVDTFEGVAPSRGVWTRHVQVSIQFRKEDGLTVDMKVYLERVEDISETERLADVMFVHGRFPYYEENA